MGSYITRCRLTTRARHIKATGSPSCNSKHERGKCYDNARMESFFATLKKEKLYRIDTTKLKREEVKKIVWRFIVYYNRRRITTINPKGYPPAIYRELFETALSKPAA
nr:integrase core domain-containing protein [Treponema parvum]